MRKYILLALIFFYFVGVNLGHPVTPSYINNLGITEKAFGYFYSAMSLGVVFGSILFGVLSDKFGKKTFIFIGAIGYAIGQLMFINLNSHVAIMVLSRFISGFFAGAPNSLLIVYIIHQYKDKQKVFMLTIYNALTLLGSSVAYKFSGNLSVKILSISGVFYMQIIYMIVFGICFLLFVKEPKVKATSNSNFFKSFKSIKSLPVCVFPLLIFVLLFTLSSTNITKYLDVLIQNVGHDPKVLGDFVFITGLVGILTNIILLPFIKKFKQINLLILLQIIQAVAIFIVFSADFSNLLIMLYTVYMPYIIAKTMTLPIEQNEISKFSTIENYGTTLGIRQAFISLGNVIGPLIGGFIFDWNNRFLFYFSGIVTIISIGVLFSFIIIKKKYDLKFNIEQELESI